MSLTLNGSSNTIAGVAVGGLPDGIVDNDMIANTTIAEGKLAANVNTITEADQWRITADVDSASTILTSNWERVDTHYDKVGTGMSESSGVFSFPQTGIWLVQFNGGARYADYARRYVGGNIQATVNNSSYASLGYTYNSFAASSGANAYAAFVCTAFFDVTNVSNCKVKVQVTADGSVTWMSGSSESYNYFTFIRLGDT